MLQEGRIPLNEAEAEAVEALLTLHPASAVSLTRRDPGNAGPVLVHVGDETHIVGDDGRTQKAQRA